jgi:CRP-like cAMP-binding protein
MVDAQRWAAVRAVCPFRLVVDDDLDQLDRELSTSEADAGETLFEEGDASDGVAALLEGTVEVVKRGRVLGVLGPGAVLGEVSMFVPSASRTATARALSPVRMTTWRAGDVSARLARHERLATSVVADLASVLATRLDRRTQDVVGLLDAVGTRLPVSELERMRARMLE